MSNGQLALVPPTDEDGFLDGRIWVIARVGDTSDVRKVEEQRLNAFSFDKATGWWVERSVPPETNIYAYRSRPKMGDYCHWCDDSE